MCAYPSAISVQFLAGELFRPNPSQSTSYFCIFQTYIIRNVSPYRVHNLLAITTSSKECDMKRITCVSLWHLSKLILLCYVYTCGETPTLCFHHHLRPYLSLMTAICSGTRQRVLKLCQCHAHMLSLGTKSRSHSER